ncbi:MAG: hypothetical protein R2825_23785 [Saprospiraceae bacterium]
MRLYQKLQITSLDQGIYTVKHADLDGGNETVLTVNKADFPGQPTGISLIGLRSNFGQCA